MNVSWTADPPEATEADTIVVGLFEGEEPRADTVRRVPDPLGELLASGEAQRSFKALALTHAEGKRWLTVGFGARKDFTPERARVAAALARERARELSTRVLCWEVPTIAQVDDASAEVARALVEGTILADYSFDLHKSAPAGGPNADTKPKHLEALIVSGGGPIESAVADAAIVAAAVNAARDLQNRPGNDLTPTALADYARALGEEIEGLQVEVEGRAGIKGLGMGAFAAVAQGSEQEPALIVLRYEGAEAKGPLLGFVGKAVTFDSGGISLKPGPKMAEMKFDMSGGATVVEAVAAIARLGLPVKLLAVVGATENLPDGRAIKPGDIVTAKNGKTIEINNTDAEGRLVLADCLCHAVSLGAERIVELGDTHRRGDHCARLDLRGDHVERRRAHQASHSRGRAHRRDPLAAAPASRVRRARRGQVRRSGQRPGSAQGGHHHGRLVPPELRRQDPLGSSRHRWLCLGSRSRLRR